MSDSCDPMDCSLPGSSVPGISPGKNTGVGCHFPLQGDLPNPETEPTSLALTGGFFTDEPPGKPPTKNLAIIFSWPVSCTADTASFLSLSGSEWSRNHGDL